MKSNPRNAVMDDHIIDEMLSSGEIVFKPEPNVSRLPPDDEGSGVTGSGFGLGVDEEDVSGRQWLLSRRLFGTSLTLGCV